MRIFILIFLSFCIVNASQQYYFPPFESDEWETTSPESLGWDVGQIEELYKYLDEENTKAFLVLKDGKIVLEKYFDDFEQDSIWYWASAGKTVTSMLIGIAGDQNLIDINAPSYTYLGNDWADITPQQMQSITVKNHLTMTTGLDDGVEDIYCTLKDCLKYKADAGSRWAYHNAPYTLLTNIIENASGESYQRFFVENLRSKIGMDGFFIYQDFNRLLVSTPRSMARFGLMMLSDGTWGSNNIINDKQYFKESIATSQNLNEAYGYLWWLNGTDSFMIPQLRTVFNGSVSANAPSDTYAALGKNGQILNVCPSQDLVLVRMGKSPDNSLVPLILNDNIWARLNQLMNPNSIELESSVGDFEVYPNPAKDYIEIAKYIGNDYELLNVVGETVSTGRLENRLELSYPNGIYFLKIATGEKQVIKKFVKKN